MPRNLSDGDASMAELLKKATKGKPVPDDDMAKSFLDTISSHVTSSPKEEEAAGTSTADEDNQKLTDAIDRLFSSKYKPADYPEDKTPFTEARPTSTADAETLRKVIEGLSKSRKDEDASTTNKETTSRIIDALGKVAAGLYGQHTKTDMGGVKTELPSFKEEFDRTREAYKESSDLAKDTAMASAKDKQLGYEDRRSQAATKRTEALGKFSAKEKQAEFGADQSTKYDLAKIAADVKDRAAAGKQAKVDTTTQSKEQARVDKASKDILSAINDTKMDDEAKAGTVAAIVQNTYGIPAEQVRAMLVEKGGDWLGMVDGIKDPTEQLKVVTTLLQGQHPSQVKSAAPAGGMVTVTHKPTGKSKQYQANDPAVTSAKTNPDFEVR